MKHRRRVFKLLLFLLAGAIINVAVAWACASCALLHSRDPAPSEWTSEMMRAHIDWAKAYNVSSYHHWERSGLGCQIEIVGVTKKSDPADELHQVREYRAGFPLYSLNGRRVEQGTAMMTVGLWCLQEGVVKAQRPMWHGNRPERRAVPLRPLWPGFAINTIFYAAIVWMLCAVPGAVRRRVRIKRGQCASCGYSLRDITSEKCPECGVAVASAQTQQRN
jgi:hypothetical protein